MTGFSWSEWLGITGRQQQSREMRKARKTKVPQVEGLEERTLLTAAFPVAVDDSYTVNEDETLHGTTVLDNDTDADSDPIGGVVLGTPPSQGILELNSDGSFTYTPNANFNGFDSFTYYAKDTVNDETSLLPATVTIQVTAISDTPVADSASIAVEKNTPYDGTLTGSDGDGDILTFLPGSVIAEHGIVEIQANGMFTYTPNSGYSGTDSFSFKTNDGSSDSLDATVTVTIGNHAPEATAQGVSTDEDTPYLGTLTGSDSDNDPLTYIAGSVSAAHGTLTINLDGSFTYTPGADFHGTDSFSFITHDGTENSPEATVTITVNSINDAPVADATSVSVIKNVVLNGMMTGSDADEDSITFLPGTVTPTHGSVLINADGTFTYTPDSDYIGTDSFSFKTNDGTLDSSESTITVTVQNQIPVADIQSFDTNKGTVFNGTLTGSDPDGDSITYYAGSIAAAHGTVSINTDGTFTYTPDPGYDGTDSFGFITNDGTDDSLEVIVTVTVVNQAPVADPQSFNTDEDTLYEGTLAGSDPDSDALTFLQGTVSAAHGSVVINLDGTFTYTPDADYNGSDSFSFITNDGTDNSPEATITITVNPINDAPRATAETITANKNVDHLGMLAAVDPEGDTFDFHAGSVTPLHGTVTINLDGSYTYTPDANYIGPDSFSFTADDGSGAGPEGLITINVVNNAPIAATTTATTAEDTAVGGTLTGFDPDGDSFTFAPGTTSPEHGSIAINSDGTFVYTPDANYYGTDTFSFTTFDGTDTSTEAIVTVTINPVNDAPIASAATETTPTNVDLNGTLAATDIDENPLTYLPGTITPAHGTVTINSDGTYTYTPTVGYSGVDSFSFKVNDGTVDSPEALVAITISNAGPTVSDGSGITDEDNVLLGSVSPLGLDLNGDPLTYTVVTPPAHGTLVLSPDGVFAYIPNANYSGTDSFEFKATDGQAISNTGTFEITVTAVDDAFDLTLSTTPQSILKNGVQVPIDTGATVGDVDTQISYGGSTVTVSILSGANKKDVLSIKNQGTGIGLVKVKGTKIYYNGSTTAVATFSGGHGKPLRIVFNANASEAAVNAVLKQIGFKTPKSGGAGTRVIQYLVNAGVNTSQKTINVNVV